MKKLFSRKGKYEKQKPPYLRIVLSLLVGVALAVVVLLCAIMVSFVQYGLNARRNAQMSQYITQLEAEQVQLQQQYEDGYDLEDIRDIAGALGMIPAQDAPQIEIDVPQPQQEQAQLSFWESIATFLAGLFA